MDKKNQQKTTKLAPQPPHKAHPAPGVSQQEYDALREKYVRAYADMENIKKHTQAEIVRRSQAAVGAFALDLLTVADNLERALAQEVPAELAQNDYMKNLRAGLELTHKALMSALAKQNIRPIESMGKVFDPACEKVIQQVKDDKQPEGTVVQVWQKGYMSGENHVLREAMVVVTQK